MMSKRPDFQNGPGYWEIALLIVFMVLVLVALLIFAPQSSGTIFTHIGYGL